MGKPTITSDWSDVISQERNDLVFEHRNKEYGAYQIRREYDNAVLLALLITASFFILTFTVPTALNYLFPAPSVAPPDVDINEWVEREIVYKKEDVVVPKAPEQPKQLPLNSTKQFVVFKVTDDPVRDDEPILSQDKTDPGSVTVDFSGDPITLIPIDQPPGNVIEDNTDKTEYISVTEMPVFPGGQAGFQRYLAMNLKYPVKEKMMGVTGTVHIGFVIGPEGTVVRSEILSGVPHGKGLEEEAMRVINSMPVWKPGKNNGYPVKVYFTVPVRFSLN